MSVISSVNGENTIVVLGYNETQYDYDSILRSGIRRSDLPQNSARL